MARYCDDNARECDRGCGSVCQRPRVRCVGAVVGSHFGPPQRYRCRRSGCGNEWWLGVTPEPFCAMPNGEMPAPPSAADYIRSALRLFEERNVVYKDGYKRAGAALLAIFPEGGIPAIRTAEDAQRLRMITMCVMKLQRYASNFPEGGHADSAEDLIMYAAFLREATK